MSKKIKVKKRKIKNIDNNTTKLPNKHKKLNNNKKSMTYIRLNAKNTLTLFL